MSKMNKLPKRSNSNIQIQVEEPVELENHFILRLPIETAEQVRNWLQEGGAAFKDKLSIQFQPDMRHAQIKVNREIYYGKLVDLPCVLETLKTLDKKTFYKVTDVGQMLVCKTEPDEADEDHKQKESKSQKNLLANEKDPKKKDKQYQWPHGITAPLKNVRKRRFRKTLKKKYMDAPELEKELKRLLREDMEAVNVRWEVVTAEQELQQKLKTQKQKGQPQSDQQGASTSGVQSGVVHSNTQPVLRSVDELFGGALSSSSSDEGGSEIEPIGDSDAEIETTITSLATPKQNRGSESITNLGEDEEDADGRGLAQQLLITNVTENDEDRSTDFDSGALRMRIVQLQSELMQMEKTRRAYETQVNLLDSLDEKEQMQREIQDLLRKDKEIRDEVTSLKKELQRKP